MTPGPTDTLQHAHLTGSIWQGLTASTRDGKPARLAIIDDAGNVIEAGATVARECWNVVLQVHRNYLQDQGHLVVHSTPPGLPRPVKAAA
jgi:hypothetical protein